MYANLADYGNCLIGALKVSSLPSLVCQFRYPSILAALVVCQSLLVCQSSLPFYSSYKYIYINKLDRKIGQGCQFQRAVQFGRLVESIRRSS